MQVNALIMFSGLLLGVNVSFESQQREMYLLILDRNTDSDF